VDLIEHYIKDITFADKQFFWLFLLLPVMIAWYLFKLRKQEAEFNYSSFQNLGTIQMSYKAILRHVVFAFRLFGLALSVALKYFPPVSSAILLMVGSSISTST